MKKWFKENWGALTFSEYSGPPVVTNRVPIELLEPIPATEQLKRNLERAEETYRLREHVLLAEIADRQAELVDVRRAADAVMAGLLGLEVRVDG